MNTVHKYRYFRALGMTARDALEKARTTGGCRYIPESGNFGGTAADDERWTGDRDACGLRFLGFADELAPRAVKHKGWFTVDDGWTGETLRGAVFLLPGRNGHARAVPGYVDSVNDGATVALRWADVEEVDARHGETDNADFRDVAVAADRMAELAAEKERDYGRAWDAGARYSTVRQEARDALKKAREIIRASRDNVTGNATICETLRERVEELREEARELLQEARDLANGDREDFYWYTGDDALREAFNNGRDSA